MGLTAFDRVAGQIPFYGDRLLRLPGQIKSQASEIRLKAGQPLSVSGREGSFFMRESGEASRRLDAALPRVPEAQLREIFLHICGRSVFSHEEELRQGYVQIPGGCRVGVCGTSVTERGQVKSLRDITSLVFRIPREIPGCSDRLLRNLHNIREGLLIAGEPGSGKTTLLRDLIQALSLGRHGPCFHLAVLDCRGELGGGFDLGPGADVLRGYPKARGMDMAIRCLAPELVACDELAQEELPAIRQAAAAGVGLIATVHVGRGDPLRRDLCRKLLETGAFGSFAVLKGRQNPCEIAHIHVSGECLAPESGAGP